MNMGLFSKLRHPYIWKRILYERLTEPLHLNMFSLFVALAGSFRSKVACDLIPRQPYAFGILSAADRAKRLGLRKITVIEFGVASGGGLLNMCDLARRVTIATGVNVNVVGFDSGCGMPPPCDYRDHPDLYQIGDFPMAKETLRRALPPWGRIVLGELNETVPAFTKELRPECPLGFFALDVDYFSSSIEALHILSGQPDAYLPVLPIYLDDLEDERHNSACGELLAISEFSARRSMRPIERHDFLRSYRLFRNARWIDHMFFAHILDHPDRQLSTLKRKQVVLENSYL